MLKSITDEIRAFIVENFLFGEEVVPLEADTLLIEAGLVDSTGVLELVAFVEERYGIEIADADIVPDNLNSIGRLARFIQARAPATVPAN